MFGAILMILHRHIRTCEEGCTVLFTPDPHGAVELWLCWDVIVSRRAYDAHQADLLVLLGAVLPKNDSLHENMTLSFTI